MILKTQINVRMGADMNMSQSFEHIVDGDDEAERAGVEDARAFAAYLRGYAIGAEEAAT